MAIQFKETTKRFRLTKAEAHYLKVMADMYAGGNESLWMRHALKNAPRKMLVKKPA